MAPQIGYRDRAVLPTLGASVPKGPMLLDTNVIINALAGRGPTVLRALLARLPRFFVSAPTSAELSWVRGRLDAAHPESGRVLGEYTALLERIEPEKILVPDGADWLAAGEMAGSIARALAGGGRQIRTAFDRVELINDALTATVARRAGCTVITEDGDFDLLMQIDRELSVLFYDRIAVTRAASSRGSSARPGRAPA